MRETYIITHSLQFISIKISFADKNQLKCSFLTFFSFRFKEEMLFVGCEREKKLSCYMENKKIIKRILKEKSYVKINCCRLKSLFLLIFFSLQ